MLTLRAGPSLLPGWTRGHVLTHLARNAEGGTRLLGWARTGVPSHEYESLAARAAAIEAGADRPAEVLIHEVRQTADAFAAAATRMRPDAWQRVVRYAAGQEPRAEVIVPSRLAEVNAATRWSRALEVRVTPTAVSPSPCAQRPRAHRTRRATVVISRPGSARQGAIWRRLSTATW
ncbi:MAG TPA: maleylpyruvate isomerase N-terminal domain-containing protein [Streptosporangiaceae bacterium]|nr:maleylpyruvate isomerase N-terminal domain-containing protein [Streptosporangiaceae bacterium]